MYILSHALGHICNLTQNQTTYCVIVSDRNMPNAKYQTVVTYFQPNTFHLGEYPIPLLRVPVRGTHKSLKMNDSPRLWVLSIEWYSSQPLNIQYCVQNLYSPHIQGDNKVCYISRDASFLNAKSYKMYHLTFQFLWPVLSEYWTQLHCRTYTVLSQDYRSTVFHSSILHLSKSLGWI